MNAPPAFPRIPRFPSGPYEADDRVLDPDAAARLLSESVVVEEKIDGSNVCVYLDEARSLVAHGRSGPTGQDRAGQYGRLRAWAGEHRSRLEPILLDRTAIYGEWILLPHSIPYDALPSCFIVLDLWHPDRGFATAFERDERCAGAGLATVPVVFRGVLGSIEKLASLCGRSAFGAERAEGLVVRLERDGRLVERAKWIAPGFVPKPDEAWSTRARNRVVGPEAR